MMRWWEQSTRQDEIAINYRVAAAAFTKTRFKWTRVAQQAVSVHGNGREYLGE